MKESLEKSLKMLEIEREIVNQFRSEIQTKQANISENELEILKTKIYLEKKSIEIDWIWNEYDEILWEKGIFKPK